MNFPASFKKDGALQGTQTLLWLLALVTPFSLFLPQEPGRLARLSVVLATGLWAAFRSLNVGKAPDPVGRFGQLMGCYWILYGLAKLTGLFSPSQGFQGRLAWDEVLTIPALLVLAMALRIWRPKDSRGAGLLEDALFGWSSFLILWLLGLRYLLEAPGFQASKVVLIGGLLLISILSGQWAQAFLCAPDWAKKTLLAFGLLVAWAVLRNALELAGTTFEAAWMGPLSKGLDPLRNMVVATSMLWLIRDSRITTPKETPPRMRAFSRWLPYAPIILASLVLLGLGLHKPTALDATTFAFILPAVGLLLVRQALFVHGTEQRNEFLETQVAARTHSLERAQTLILHTERMNTMASLGAGLVHDLNNLIGVSKIYAELVESDVKEGRLPDLQNVQRIKEATTKAGDFTMHLMAYGHRNSPAMLVFDLRRHLNDRYNLFRMVARHPVELILDTGDSELPLRMDPTQVDQLLVNLLSNARDAMPMGGQIFVRCRKDGKMALLEVQDQGSGIPESVRDQIFEPFFTTKEPGHGTGLGLASVKALVDHCHGSLSIESIVGEGTTFWIRLPLHATHPEG